MRITYPASSEGYSSEGYSSEGYSETQQSFGQTQEAQAGRVRGGEFPVMTSESLQETGRAWTCPVWGHTGIGPCAGGKNCSFMKNRRELPARRPELGRRLAVALFSFRPNAYTVEAFIMQYL